MHKLIALTLFALALNFNNSIIAQKFRVVASSVEDMDNKLLIKYEILNSNAKQNFKVSLKITNSSGIIITTNSLTGDIGENVTGGSEKMILWDYIADTVVLQEDINIELFALLLQEDGVIIKEISKPKAILLSTVFPGLGLSKSSKGKPYWLMGVAGYASLGASIFYHNKAKESYNSYIENTLEEFNDELLNRSQDQQKFSRTMAYSAAGIWGVNMIWTLLKINKTKKKELGFIKRHDIYFVTGFDYRVNTTNFTLKFNF